MVTSTNYTEYGIHSTGERCLWVTWLMIVLLSSLIGDSIILIASVRYNAIKLNKFLVVIMQHIAVCDILASLSIVLPTMISLMANKWVLGDAVAYIQVYLNFSSVIANNMLICTLVSSKVLLLKFPISARSWTTKHAHVMCVIVAWVPAVVIPAARVYFDKYGLVFSYIEYNMNFGLSSEYSKADEIIIYLYSILAVYIPTLILIVATICIIVYLLHARKAAKQSGGDIRWQGMVTVVATAALYGISNVPYTSFIIVVRVIYKGSSPTAFRTFESLSMLNYCCNFFIYSNTIPSFRQFIKAKVSGVSVKLRGSDKVGGENKQPNGTLHNTEFSLSVMSGEGKQDSGANGRGGEL